MSNEQKGIEIKVGLFVFVGLMAIGAMSVYFGRVGQAFVSYYHLTVEFPNASGLIRDAEIQLGGAVVGKVAEKPRITPGKIGSVLVGLDIQDDIKIPVGSKFTIGSSGLLGDKFVDIAPPENLDQSKFNPSDPKQVYQNQAMITGSDAPGIDSLTKQGQTAMESMNARLEELKTTINEINTKLPLILSDANLKNLQDTFASLKTTGDNFAEASKKIDGVVAGAQGVVDSAKETMVTAKQTMDSAKGTMDNANGAVTDFRESLKDVRKTVLTAQDVMKSAQKGPGIIPMLIGNSELADNLKAFVSNIRRHGVLFYKDNGDSPATTPQPVNASKSKSR